MPGPNRINVVGMLCSCAGHAVLGGLLLSVWSTPPGKPISEQSLKPLVLELLPLDHVSELHSAAASPKMKVRHAAAVYEAEIKGHKDAVLAAPTTLPAGLSVSTETTAISATVASAASQADLSDYQRRLYELVARNSRYPEEAKRQHLAGVTQLAFRLDRSGNVLESWIQESSGSEMLDTAALEALDRAQPLPPIPVTLPSRLSFVVEIDSSVIRKRASLVTG